MNRLILLFATSVMFMACSSEDEEVTEAPANRVFYCDFSDWRSADEDLRTGQPLPSWAVTQHGLYRPSRCTYEVPSGVILTAKGLTFYGAGVTKMHRAIGGLAPGETYTVKVEMFNKPVMPGLSLIIESGSARDSVYLPNKSESFKFTPGASVTIMRLHYRGVKTTDDRNLTEVESITIWK